MFPSTTPKPSELLNSKEENMIPFLWSHHAGNFKSTKAHKNKKRWGKTDLFCRRAKGPDRSRVTLDEFCHCVTPKRSTFRNIQITQLATSAQDYKRPCQENVLEMQPSKTRVTPGWVILWKERKIGLLIIARQCCNNKTFESPNTPRLQRQTVSAKEDAKIWINLCWNF